MRVDQGGPDTVYLERVQAFSVVDKKKVKVSVLTGVIISRYIKHKKATNKLITP